MVILSSEFGRKMQMEENSMQKILEHNDNGSKFQQKQISNFHQRLLKINFKLELLNSILNMY